MEFYVSEEDANSIFTVNPDSALKMKLERKSIFLRSTGGLKMINVIDRGFRDL
jgi:hypothetical protein